MTKISIIDLLNEACDKGFLPVLPHSNIYISADGKTVINYETEHVYKQVLNNSGYLIVYVNVDGTKSKTWSVQKLQAMTTQRAKYRRLNREHKKPQADHINDNRTDNRRENIRFVSAKRNNPHNKKRGK